MLSFGRPFSVLNTIDSTNNYAMQMVHARMATHGAAWFAEEQTVGKGQRGKSWMSNKGENIAMSVVVEPGFLLPVNAFWLTAAIANGVCDFVKSIAGEETSIKWPNDIYWRDRKAGGILIETLIRSGNWQFAVIGTGININQVKFPPLLNKAVSLRQITGKLYNVIDLAKELCGFMEMSYKLLEEGKQEIVLQQYSSNLYKQNQEVQFKTSEESFTAIVRGITSEGLLEIERAGVKKTLMWGAAEWVIEL